MSRIRKPIVGPIAWRYVLITVVSFATSVVGTRLYLEITGYPQIGNATYHFAHALWGGLLQVVAVLLLLIYVNRWVYTVSAVLGGVGIGLFIDEVGKFITQSNNYFFPLAAPIIYVAFLLMMLIYLIVNRRASSDMRADMYQVLRELEEVLEDDLSPSERDLMLSRLERIAGEGNRPDLVELANHLSAFLRSETIILVPERDSWSVRLVRGLKRIEERLLTQKLSRLILLILYTINGFFSVAMLFILLSLINGPEDLKTELFYLIMGQSNVEGVTSANWYVVMIALHLLTGLLLFLGALAFIVRRDGVAIALGVVSLIITLTFINTLSFYFNQFSILLDSIYSFLALLALQRYRDRFLRHKTT